MSKKPLHTEDPQRLELSDQIKAAVIQVLVTIIGSVITDILKSFLTKI